MTWLYGYLAALGGLIMAVLTFGAYQRRKGVIGERENTVKKATDAAIDREEQRNEIDSRNDGNDAAGKLRDKWTRPE